MLELQQQGIEIGRVDAHARQHRDQRKHDHQLDEREGVSKGAAGRPCRHRSGIAQMVHMPVFIT